MRIDIYYINSTIQLNCLIVLNCSDLVSFRQLSHWRVKMIPGWTNILDNQNEECFHISHENLNTGWIFLNICH